LPDPFLYLLAVVTSAGLSALVAFGLARGRVSPGVVNSLATAAGIAIGTYLLKLPVNWPPSTGLGRLFAILLPAAVAIEILSALPAVQGWLRWIGRLMLAMAAARILLHGSVYLSADHAPWPTWQAIFLLGGSGCALAAVWALLLRLGQRSESVSIPLALAEAIVGGGLTIMLKGYVGGGEASLPIVGAIVGCSVAAGLRSSQAHVYEGVIGIGVVALFGLLFVGRFFGNVSSASALALFLAPLLCWTTELPSLRGQPRWRVACIRLAIVAIPLIAVLLFAKRDFDHDTLPLL
jgi:hypothetical protein